MSTLSDISIFVSRDWSPSLRNSCADVTVKRTGLPVECFCVSEYLSYVRHLNAILYVWHTPMCVCALMLIAEWEIHAYRIQYYGGADRR